MESTPLPSQQQAIANKRREKDIMKLMVSDYQVTLAEHPISTGKVSSTEFFVKLKGPSDSPYESVSAARSNFYIGCVDCASDTSRGIPV